MRDPTDMSWWTDIDARTHNLAAIERDRKAAREYGRVIEVPRRCGIMEQLEVEIGKLAEVVRGAATTGR